MTNPSSKTNVYRVIFWDDTQDFAVRTVKVHADDEAEAERLAVAYLIADGERWITKRYPTLIYEVQE